MFICLYVLHDKKNCSTELFVNKIPLMSVLLELFRLPWSWPWPAGERRGEGGGGGGDQVQCKARLLGSSSIFHKSYLIVMRFDTVLKDFCLKI